MLNCLLKKDEKHLGISTWQLFLNVLIIRVAREKELPSRDVVSQRVITSFCYDSFTGFRLSRFASSYFLFL